MTQPTGDAVPAPTGLTLIDRVDSMNRPIGTVMRGQVFEQHANFRTVHVVLTNADGAVLVQQLAANRSRHPGQWGTSVAGYLFAGESYRAAAERRTKDELGISVELVSRGVVAMADDAVTKFIGVFTGECDHPRINEPEHVAALEFRSVDTISAELSSGLSTYTASFAHVFQYWRTIVAD